MIDKKVLHAKALVSKQVEEGVVEAVVGSSEVLDRMGDKIDQGGWELKNYKKNPVILWGHNVMEERPPIGKALKVWIDKTSEKAQLMFKVQFDLQDNFAAEIYRKVKDKFINTVSVGFIPKEVEPIDEKKPFNGSFFRKQELLELSFVPVPANPEALVSLQKAGLKPIKDLSEIYQKEIVRNETITKEGVVKPLPNEHACRLKDPDDFQDDSFRSQTREHEGKKYRVIMGKLKDEDTMTDQSFRYKKTKWEKSDAEAHCKDHDGTFEAAEEESEAMEKPKDVSIPVEKVSDKKDDMPVVSEKIEEDKLKDNTELKEDKEDKKEVKPETENEPIVKNFDIVEFKDLGIMPESEPWDEPGERVKAKEKDLEIMATLIKDKKELKEYLLLHHQAQGHKAVWRGVAMAMAILMGAKGKIDINNESKKLIYDHLVKHYKQFEKEAPEFKLVEDQVLSELIDEVHALILDREDKYAVRLTKKLIKLVKEANKIEMKKTERKYTPQELITALQVVDKAISLSIQKPTGKEV